MLSHPRDQLKYLAKECFDYFYDPLNKEDLILAINEMEIKYNEPINNPFYGIFYQYFRTRPFIIDALKKQIQYSNKPSDWMWELIDFFQQGAWTTTSANTYLMQNCLKKMSRLTKSSIENIFLNIYLLKQLNAYFIEYAHAALQENNLNFLNILKNHFVDIYTKINYQAKFKKLYEHDLLTRAFDDLPFSIISDIETTRLQNRFKQLLEIKINHEMEISDQDKKAIMNWELIIIEMAVNNLLDASHGIKPEILDLFECQAPFTPKQIIELICAYVGRVNHQIIMLSADLIQDSDRNHTFTSMCNFINKNYGHWVADFLKKEEKNNDLYLYSAIAIGSGLLITTATLSFIFFKSSTQANSNQTPIEKSPTMTGLKN